MKRVVSTLEDGRKIAFFVAEKDMETFLAAVIANVDAPIPSDAPVVECGECGQKRMPTKASEPVMNDRRRICMGCEHHGTNGGWHWCAKGECNLEFKTMLAKASCPAGKWKE